MTSDGMHAWLSARPFGLLRVVTRRHADASPPDGLAWHALPRAARAYVAAVVVVGAFALLASFPLTYPRPVLFTVLLVAACLTSTWKVNLPISIASGSTLSVSHAADLTALLLLGPRHAVVVAVAGAWTQCTFKVKQPYPLYRTMFSASAEAITMVTTGLAYGWLGGPTAPLDFSGLPKPLVGAIATYFFVNTGLVAGAIALSTGRRFGAVWQYDFGWSGASFMVAGGTGALAAVIIGRGAHWQALLMLAPVYLTYRTYQLFVARLEDHKQHIAETRRLHQDAVEALRQAREAERALADEKERLAVALAEMTRLEDTRNQLLAREHTARANAEHANRLKDQFLAMVSHELRTPLNAMLGWADMLRHGTLEDARRDRALQSIYDSAKRQAQLIDELLDLARIMSAKLRLEQTPVDLKDIVRGALEVVQPAAEAKRIHIALEADPAIDKIYGDGGRLQQIVWNLLTNAVKFTPESGTVHVRLRRADASVELAVTDTGQGIAPDFLPSVFEPFRQGDGSTTRSHGGLGLGLSIVKHLVEAHGGTVSAESDGPGQGSTFTVRLPIGAAYADQSEAAAADPSASPNEKADATASLEGISVLVVDDDDESREVVAACLQGHHAVVLTATSAAQAFDLLQRERVDVLLSDVAMPGEDGYTLIRKVRTVGARETASIPAAALTAFARDEDRQRALQAGFQLHLTKPIDARSLVDAVASLGKVNPT